MKRIEVKVMRMAKEERGYPVLYILSWVLKVAAVLLLVVSIVDAILTPGATTAFVIAVAIVAAISAIIVYALGDLVLVVMDIEHNTFLTSQELKSRVAPQAEERRAG